MRIPARPTSIQTRGPSRGTSNVSRIYPRQITCSLDPASLSIISNLGQISDSFNYQRDGMTALMPIRESDTYQEEFSKSSGNVSATSGYSWTALEISRNCDYFRGIQRMTELWILERGEPKKGNQSEGIPKRGIWTHAAVRTSAVLLEAKNYRNCHENVEGWADRNNKKECM